MFSGRATLRYLGILLMLSWATSSSAQLNRGVIDGTVTDPQGAVVPGVDVTVTSLDTNVAATTKTNSTGYYRAADLVPGTYRAHFGASGFSPLDITDIEVGAGKVVRVDGTLKLGATQQEVRVTAAPPLLETAAANFSTTLGTRAIHDLPLAGRDLQQLVFLVPGVNPVGGPPGANFGFDSEFGSFPDPTHVFGSDLSVNGGQGGENAWYLDGNLNQVGFAENLAVNPSPDSVQEFQSITNAFSAEYGRTGGAVFNVVLSSGTNSLHGDLYEFGRNSFFNARNPFTSIDSLGKIIPQHQLRYNDFGGTVGGPVLLPGIYNGKNRTFFFFSWDTSILHLSGNSVFTVPTPRMRQGDFSEDPLVTGNGLWDPNTTVGPDPTTGLFQRTAFGTPVPGNPFGASGCTNTAVEAGANCNLATAIPAGRLDPTPTFFAQSFPQPNYLDPLAPQCSVNNVQICNNFIGPVASSQDTDNISIKIDHQWNERSRYFGEWLFSPGKYNNFRVPWTGPTFPQDSVGFGGQYPVDYANQVIALGHTYTFGPTVVNQFRVSFNRQFLTTHPGHPFPDSISAQTQVQQELAPLRIPEDPFFPTPNWSMTTPGGGFLSFGPTSWVNMTTMAEAYTILDNVTKVLGRHTLKTGFAYRLEHSAYESGFPSVFSFGGGLVQDPNTGLGGSGLAQFMLGAVANDGSSTLGVTSTPYERWRYWSGYVQDDFRITSGLTLNLGVRYEVYGLFNLRQKPASNFCLGCPNSTTGLTGKMIYVGDAGWPGGGTDIGPPNYNDFAPRVNFAWSPFKDRKTVIRGGYDIFFTPSINGLNSPGQGAANEPGWSVGYPWVGSGNPAQCTTINSGQCVVFPLSDTSKDKGSLTTPTFTRIVPAQKRASLLGLTGIDPFAPPAHDPMVQMWSFEIQRELPGNTALSVGYVGSHGTHLLGSDRNYNYVHTRDLLNYHAAIDSNVPITSVYSGSTAALLAQVYNTSDLPRSILLKDYPFYDSLGNTGLLTFAAFEGASIYHGLNVRFEKRPSRGLEFIAAYTISKKINNPWVGQPARQLVDPIHWAHNNNLGGRAGELAWSGGFGTAFQDRDNFKVDRAIAADDIPQILNVAATYELPFGRGRHFGHVRPGLDHLVGGWKLTANFNAEGGLPLSVTGPCDELQSRTTAIGCRVNLIGDPHFSGPRSRQQKIAQWINPAAFEPSFGSDQTFWANYDPTDPRAWLFGTAGPVIPNLRSPGFWNVDTSLAKDFHITESKYLQFRWEAFNALNHQNLGIPNAGFCVPTPPGGTDDKVHVTGCSFGQITNVQTDPRAMEFALKFFW